MEYQKRHLFTQTRPHAHRRTRARARFCARRTPTINRMDEWVKFIMYSEPTSYWYGHGVCVCVLYRKMSWPRPKSFAQQQQQQQEQPSVGTCSRHGRTHTHTPLQHDSDNSNLCETGVWCSICSSLGSIIIDVIVMTMSRNNNNQHNVIQNVFVCAL